jgi:hypothetical protein
VPNDLAAAEPANPAMTADAATTAIASTRNLRLAASMLLSFGRDQ